MKKKKRIILGKGYVKWNAGCVGLYTKGWVSVNLRRSKEFRCYCEENKCKCKYWTLVLEQ